MKESHLRRRPLRTLLSQLFMAVFGWMNPEQHRESKRLTKENLAIRRALHEPEISGKQPDENPDKKKPATP